MKYLANALSLQMLLPFFERAIISVRELNEAPDLAGVQSHVGHQELADMLGVPVNREPLKLEVGDVLYVAQYVGGRLQIGESPTEELKNKIKFFEVTVNYM